MKKFYFMLTLLLSSPAWSIKEGFNYEGQYKHLVQPFLNSSIPIKFSSFDQKTIHAYYFKRNFKKLLLIIPGYTEPAYKYQEMVYDLKDEKYDFIVLNLRSQGKSDRLLEDTHKVYIENYTDYLKDLDRLHQLFIKPAGYEEVTVMAHSLGGAIAMAHAEKNPTLYNKLALSSPMLEIKTKFSEGMVRSFAKVASLVGLGKFFVPGKGSSSKIEKFDTNRVTSSQKRFEAYNKLRAENEKDNVTGATINWLKQAFDLADFAFENREKIKDIPVLLFLAGKDELSYHNRQKQMCQEHPNCDEVFFKDGKHELFVENDEIRDHVLRKIRYFLANGNPIIPDISPTSFTTPTK